MKPPVAQGRPGSLREARGRYKRDDEGEPPEVTKSA